MRLQTLLFPLTLLAAAGAAMLSACGGSDEPAYSAEIRRTAYGIPHIKAKDEAGLGYGAGYAEAQENACPLAEQFITLRGERSRYFGPDAHAGDDSLANEGSDFFYRFYNDEARLRAAWAAQDAQVQALMKGFAAGFNRYVQEAAHARLPTACRGAEWLPHVDELDMMRLVRYYGGVNGVVFFKSLLVQAQPPSAGAAAVPAPAPAEVTLRRLGLSSGAARRTASNAVALGRDATDTGRGLLLGNPHQPWNGPLRLHELHLTLPGRIDAMGATLPGLPLVAIGFTRRFAWSHTTSASAHSTFYRLQLDPADPTRYLVDGQSRPMTRRRVSIAVHGANGRLTMRTHEFYVTEFGVVAMHPQSMPWTSREAYAFRDVNDDNDRILAQWYAMNRATSLQELKASVTRIVANPWANTVAADDRGDTLFMDVLPVPNLTKAQVAQCTVPGFEDLSIAGTLVLEGNTAACAWNDDPAAPQRGIFAGAALPTLSRSDYVQNANDSAWLSNPAAPLAGYSPVVSLDHRPQSLRTRLGIARVQARLAGGDGQPGRTMSMDQLQSLVLDNRAYLADLVLDDLLSLCPGGTHASAEASADLTHACTALAAWDRTADLDAGIGYACFEALAAGIESLPPAWRVPFDPTDPIHTPRGLNVDDPVVAESLRGALAAAMQTLRDRGWEPGLTWGKVQFATRGVRRIPIHGGDERLGIYNAIYSDPDAVAREVTDGTSYLQVVGFGASGPQARALLSHSQSTDPASPHFADQTELFSRKQWITLPFTEAEIRADAQFTTQRISE
ncbi:MAG TPA: penicillin acylase family protein [Burkholderiaceae bacterium]|nr:penicillin acylase family protein [Burkholderiaceae bacterium]